jgi:hypothetical protein
VAGFGGGVGAGDRPQPAAKPSPKRNTTATTDRVDDDFMTASFFDCVQTVFVNASE